MKRLIFVTLVMVALSICLSSCEERYNGLETPNIGNIRDQHYLPEKVQMYVDGKEITTIEDVLLMSTKIDDGSRPFFDENGNFIDTVPSKYNTNITIVGYPKKGKKIKMKVISTESDFYGETKIGNKEYNIEGEFIGNRWEVTKWEFEIIIRLNSK